MSKTPECTAIISPCKLFLITLTIYSPKLSRQNTMKGIDGSPLRAQDQNAPGSVAQSPRRHSSLTSTRPSPAPTPTKSRSQANLRLTLPLTDITYHSIEQSDSALEKALSVTLAPENMADKIDVVSKSLELVGRILRVNSQR